MLKLACSIFCLWLVAKASFADPKLPKYEKPLPNQPTFTELKAQWNFEGLEPKHLRVNVGQALNEQQKKLLFSGFSTFSHLEIRWLDIEGERPLVFISECTVQYDMWEEKFELLQFLDQRQESSLQDFKQYSDLCLQARISNSSNILQLAHNAARLEVKLDISQVSNAFAQDVRDWLIQQQPGVLRSLFSRMLGDLKLSESVQIEIEVPPLPSQSKDKKPSQDGPA